MANRLQIRRDSQNNWDNINPVLADGELGLNYDNNRIKIGDGSNNWSSLQYANSGVPTLAAIATSGSFADLQNNPIPTSYSSTNNGQFLSLNTYTGNYDLTAGFRITNVANVVFPGGKIGTDQIGDVSFSQNAIYYCYQTPNAYNVNYGGSTGWVPAGWLKVNSIGPDNTIPQVGNKITDGTYTSTIQSIISPWQDQYAGNYFMLIEISPAVSSWKNGSGSFTVYTGSEPHLNAWAKLGVGIVDVPTHSNSPGTVGQIAYDSNYMYRCTQTNVSEISSVYTTPHSTDNTSGNQNAGQSMINVLDAGGVPAPQVGWVISDGSSTRTITNVVRQNSAWSYIYTLTYSGGDIDWNSLNSITIMSQPPVQAVWKRIAYSNDTW